ncbi:hypothetical protein Pst134EA_000763 [Puccinia striiformis f. sp. tritici]|nr:hypothetical protein Pst134EA_000763 [Puccinia striiformis f. sp. tritici]KAH9473684.1 hypothetical protein Pst134EA_000763 [Puccinia striiformis f. sp. tritici]
MMAALKMFLCLVLHTLGYIRLALTSPVEATAKESMTYPAVTSLTEHTADSSFPVVIENEYDQLKPDKLAKWRHTSSQFAGYLASMQKDSEPVRDRIKSLRAHAHHHAQFFTQDQHGAQRRRPRLEKSKRISRYQFVSQLGNHRDLLIMSDGLEATYKHLTQDRVFELYGGAQSVLSGLRRPEAPIDTTDRAFPSAAYQFTEADMLYKYLSTYPAHPSIHPSERKSSALSGGHSGTHSDGGFSLLEKMIDLIAMEKFEQFNKNPVRSTEKQSTQNSKKRDFNGNLKSPVQKEEIQLANQLPRTVNTHILFPAAEEMLLMLQKRLTSFPDVNCSNPARFNMEFLEAFFLLIDYIIKYQLMSPRVIERIDALQSHRLLHTVQYYIELKHISTKNPVYSGFHVAGSVVPTLEFLTTHESMGHFHRAIKELSNEGQKLVVYESLKTNNKLSKSQDWVGQDCTEKFQWVYYTFFRSDFIQDADSLSSELVKRKGKMEYNPTTRSNEVIPLLQDVIDIFLNIEGENDAAGGFEKVTAYAILKFFNSFYEPIIAEFNTSQMGHRDIKKEIKLIDDMLEISHGQPHDSETTKKEQKFIQKIQKELQEEPQMKEWITNLMFQVFDVNYPN